jgi:hypothetical protein
VRSEPAPPEENPPVHARIAALAVTLTLALAVTGCARPYALAVEETGAPLTSAQAEQLAAASDISPLASVSATDAVAMRTTALKDLSARGAFGARAAELLTIGFPEKTASVPVLVRGSTVDGVDAILVVEAFGSEGGMLVHRRLWVFDRSTGAVLRAASFS